MRFIAMVRGALYLVVLVLSLNLILSYVTAIPSPCLTCNFSPVAAELCQFLELPEKGVEGMVPRQFKLKGLAIVHRHGERSPILSGGPEVDCTPYREIDRQLFENYRNLIDSPEFRAFLKIDDKFKNWPLYPERSKCSSGNLTAEGALQLSRLGTFLRRAYGPTELFNEGNRLNIDAIASPFIRTFQSAVALISAFLFPLRPLVSEVPLHESNYTFHCVDKWCQCDAAVVWRTQYENETLQYFETRSPAELRETAQRIFGGIETTKNSSEPFQMLDIMLGRYVCRRSPLPCTPSGECVSYQLLQKLRNETTVRGQVMFNEGSRNIESRLVTAESQAILGYVAAIADALQQNPHTNIIKLFSGHDTTVGPILRTLRLPFLDFPHYESRICFEIYHDVQSRAFIRVVYNGEDRTRELPFCQGKDLCDIAAFSQFARSGMFTSIGFHNTSDLCDPSVIPQTNTYG